MSEYTQVSFRLPKDKSLKKFKRAIKWDAWQLEVKKSHDGGEHLLLTINELNFKESLFILDNLKSVFSVRFYIEHGTY